MAIRSPIEFFEGWALRFVVQAFMGSMEMEWSVVLCWLRVEVREGSSCPK